MKRFLILSILLFFCFGFSSHERIIARKNSASGTTDYTSDANCMGAWLMTSSSDETDVSGEGETLTETGDVPTSATVPSGYSGTSRDFESSDTDALYHADAGSSDISGADQAMSFVAWVKFETADSGTEMYLMCKWQNQAGYRQYQVYYYPTNDCIRAVISSNGDDWSAVAEGATDVGGDTDWHHIGVVYNDTDVRIYVDGSLDSNGSDNPLTYSDGIYDGQASFCVGSNTSGGNLEMDGLMDEVAIFNRALSAAEISEIYTNGIDGTKGASD